jgi:hypothetical protein
VTASADTARTPLGEHYLRDPHGGHPEDPLGRIPGNQHEGPNRGHLRGLTNGSLRGPPWETPGSHVGPPGCRLGGPARKNNPGDQPEDPQEGANRGTTSDDRPCGSTLLGSTLLEPLLEPNLRPPVGPPSRTSLGDPLCGNHLVDFPGAPPGKTHRGHLRGTPHG